MERASKFASFASGALALQIRKKLGGGGFDVIIQSKGIPNYFYEFFKLLFFENFCRRFGLRGQVPQ